MKEIIEKGYDKFMTSCPICGCLFNYELSDISIGNSIECPHCGRILVHPRQDQFTKGTK